MPQEVSNSNSSCSVNQYFGSDAVALLLRRLEIPYLVINPGASFRGLHDSVVNLLGNDDPRLLEIEFGEQSWVDAFTQKIEKHGKL